MKKIIIIMLKTVGVIILIPVTFWIIMVVAHWVFDRGEQTNKDFLKTLKGEVVYLHRDNNDLNLYKISATGDNNKLLYKYSDPTIQNRNVINPKWSNDGSRISFALMTGKGGQYWNLFSVNKDGTNLIQETNFNDITGDALNILHDKSGLDDKGIVLDKGNIYFIDESGNKILVYEYPRSFWHDNVWYPVEGIWHNGGAEDASWSPDKNYIIFMLNEGGSNEIMIVSKDGTQLAKLANGRSPSWK